jgi:hypothetical protein
VTWQKYRAPLCRFDKVVESVAVGLPGLIGRYFGLIGAVLAALILTGSSWVLWDHYQNHPLIVESVVGEGPALATWRRETAYIVALASLFTAMFVASGRSDCR